MGEPKPTKRVHCIVRRRCTFVVGDRTYHKGDPCTVSRSIYELYASTHLDFVEDIPDEPTTAPPASPENDHGTD